MSPCDQSGSARDARCTSGPFDLGVELEMNNSSISGNRFPTEEYLLLPALFQFRFAFVGFTFFLPKQSNSDSLPLSIPRGTFPKNRCYTAPRSWIFQLSCLVIQFAAAPMRAISGPLLFLSFARGANLFFARFALLYSGTHQYVPHSLDHCKEV